MKDLKFIASMLIFLFVAVACSSVTEEPTAEPSPTVEPTATVAFSLSPVMGEASAAADEHSHALNSPEHLHLDDGSVVATEGLPIGDELLLQLLSGEPIAVGPANANAQTVTLTMPTLF